MVRTGAEVRKLFNRAAGKVQSLADEAARRCIDYMHAPGTSMMLAEPNREGLLLPATICGGAQFALPPALSVKPARDALSSALGPHQHQGMRDWHEVTTLGALADRETVGIAVLRSIETRILGKPN